MAEFAQLTDFRNAELIAVRDGTCSWLSAGFSAIALCAFRVLATLCSVPRPCSFLASSLCGGPSASQPNSHNIVNYMSPHFQRPQNTIATQGSVHEDLADARQSQRQAQ